MTGETGFVELYHFAKDLFTFFDIARVAPAVKEKPRYDVFVTLG